MVLLVVATANSVAEEWVFRRLVLGKLLGSGLSTSSAITVSSLAFGISHVPAGLPGGMVGFGVTFLFGAVMGLFYTRVRDPRLVLISAHFSADFVMFNLLLNL
ncbi:MAG: type II CAAX prenyl endopeptidase Rce1 family protein [Acidimicrobiia bacterium]